MSNPNPIRLTIADHPAAIIGTDETTHYGASRDLLTHDNHAIRVVLRESGGLLPCDRGPQVAVYIFVGPQPEGAPKGMTPSMWHHLTDHSADKDFPAVPEAIAAHDEDALQRAMEQVYTLAAVNTDILMLARAQRYAR